MDKAIQKLLKERYYLEGENSWDDISKRISDIYPPSFDIINQKKFIPSSPTLMNANTKEKRKGTLSSCFTMSIEDSIDKIFDSLKEGAIVTKAGGGVGYDFSSLRSSEENIKSINRDSSGPIPFIKIFSSMLDGVSQGGCLTKDTYINTSKGLLRFDELIDVNSSYGWHKHDIDVFTEKGIRKSKRFYVNEPEPLKEIKFKNGSSLKGTHNHKLKVMTEKGEAWKKFDELEIGDWVVQGLNWHKGEEQSLIGIETTHFNEKNYNLPKTLNENFAFLLGLLMGDDFVALNETDYRVGYSISDDSYLNDELPKLINDVFGDVKLNIIDKGDSDKSRTFVISSKQIKSFLELNGVSKINSVNAKIPLLIRNSPKNVIGSYLAGVFEADGSLSHGFPSLITSSSLFAKEISNLLHSFGVLNILRKNRKNNSYSKAEFIYEVKVITKSSLDVFNDFVKFHEKSRFSKMNNCKYDIEREKNGVIPFPEFFLKDIYDYMLKIKCDANDRKKISRYYKWKDKRNFSIASMNRLSKKYEYWNEYVKFDKNKFYTEIVSVTDLPEEVTFDIEVEDTHSYIANGILSHNSRKGAGMAMLDVDHPNILDFIRVKNKKGEIERMNLSVRIYNDFYETLKNQPDSIHKVKLKDGNYKDLLDNEKSVTVKQLWDEIIEYAWKCAEPGIVNIGIGWNRCSVKDQSNHILTNPCQPAFAPILKQNGINTLGNVEVGDVIWSGKQWTKVIRKEYTGNKQVYSYNTNAGSFIGTENHRIVQNGKKIEVKNAVSIDISLGEFESGLINYEDVMDGLVIGNGSVHKDSNNLVYLNVDEKDKDYFSTDILKDMFIKDRKKIFKTGWEIKTSIVSEDLKKTYEREIPERFYKGTPSTIQGFLLGLFSANGSICDDRVILKQTSLKLIKQVQEMLSVLGISSYITTNKSKKIKFSDGDYVCKQSYDLNICSDKEVFRDKIGFIHGYKKESLDKICSIKQNKNRKTTFDITSIDDLGFHDVFDITVNAEEHTYWSGGLLVSNCSEFINIPYSACALGSINLSKFINNTNFDWDEFYETIKIATRFIDSTIDQNDFPLEKIEKVSKEIRPIGLGVMGLAHCLYKMKIPFNSNEALEFKERLFRDLTLISMRESIEIAKEVGESYPVFNYDVFMKANERFNLKGTEIDELIKKYGVRNSCFTSIAPTGSIGFLANTSGGIEPVFALSYARKIEKKNKEYETVFISDVVFDEYLNQNFDEKTKNRILKKVSENKGSCQTVEEIPEEDKKVFVVAGDISPMEHLSSLGVVANNVSLSVSKTINMPSTATKEEISEVYLKAYELGVIGVTVYRDGCREGVLIHETDEENKPLIVKNNAPKRPKSLPCHVYRMNIFNRHNNESEKWVVFVGLLNDDPYEIIAGKIGDIDFDSSIKDGELVKIKKNGKSVYQFKNDEEVIIENVQEAFLNDIREYVTRLMSLSLRHGASIEYLKDVLQKSDGSIVDFNKAIIRAINKYVKFSNLKERCPTCNAELIYYEGCIKCSNLECGFSKCG